MVDFADNAAEAAFRAEVREFLDETKATRADGRSPGATFGRKSVDEDKREDYDAWRAALAERGWIAPHWPKEYGGAGLSVLEQSVLNEEFAEAETGNVGGFGTMMIGPTLIVHGTEEQKSEYLAKILDGDISWCQGWSEPGAGSDLASLQTRATRDGDEFVISGQKIWTSGAQYTDHMYMLARTDPDAPKHRGISFFMFPMDSPGVTVRPLTQMTGQAEFNEVFFEDVHVPAANMVGEENRGWYVGATLMDFERSGIGSSVGTRKRMHRMLEAARKLPDDQSMLKRSNPTRLAFADRYVEAEVSLLFSYRIVTMQNQGLVPNYEASMSKLFSSEMNQRIAATNLKLYGQYGTLFDREREEAQKGQVAQTFLRSIANTVEGGSSEIQRNIIATRGLGLPRG
jgi:alkylation response protein AidB-like acyl-CoA dehydrogenase